MEVKELVEISKTFVDNNNEKRNTKYVLEQDGRWGRLVAILATFQEDSFEGEFKSWIKEKRA